jgi:putative FmdB family regulatory protein
MPIYEYRCTDCGHQQEFLQRVSDTPLTVCTQCGKPTFSKMVTAAGFQLKGSGWYATDFKNSGKSPSSKASDSKGESKGEPKSEPTSESKAETKPAGESKAADTKPAAPSKPAASSGDA